MIYDFPLCTLRWKSSLQDCCATYLLLDVVLIITTIMGEKESSIYIREREALFVVVRLPRARPSPSLGMMSSRWMTKEGRPVDDSNVSRAHQLPHSSTPSSSLSLFFSQKERWYKRYYHILSSQLYYKFEESVKYSFNLSLYKPKRASNRLLQRKKKRRSSIVIKEEEQVVVVPHRSAHQVLKSVLFSNCIYTYRTIER